MDFPDDIDASQFLDQLSWEAQDEDDEDNGHRRRESLDKTSEFSCDLGIKQDPDDGPRYLWDDLMGFDDRPSRAEDKVRCKSSDELVDQKIASDGGGAAFAQHPQQQISSTAQSFPPMASYESIMGSGGQSHQQSPPHLLTHPLAMTSLSSCPSFPLPSSSSVSGNEPSNGVAAGENMDSSSVAYQETSSASRVSMPPPSTISGTTSNANSSQTGSSQTSGSNNSSSISSNSNNFFNNQRPLLPSWNESMGDLMYSPLFNVGIPSTTNSDGTSANPFQCTPLNSAFGANYQQTSMINHYGMAINGFHPQVNAIVNPVLPLNSTMPPPARAGTTSPGTVKTSNAGKSTSSNAHLPVYAQQQQPQKKQPPEPQRQSKPKDKKATSERNEREQIRAKKITQLIHEIRSNMEAEGWKEEMKSKYETLSQCKAYMEYLKRCHKEKEIDIEHTKKLLEEKALLEGRSDPESIHDSVTSSLTASSRRSTSPEENGSDKDSSSSSDNDQGHQSRKKRKTISYAEGIKSPTSETSNKKSRSSRGKRKEPSSSESSSEEDAGNEGEGPGGKNISFDKTSSSVSDMTDSNRSSMNGASINKKKQGQQSQASSEIGTASTATSSISSTAAVMRGSSHKSPQSHRRHRSKTLDAVAETHCESQKKAHKKKRRSFDYNYKEVFLKSNIPQLIVTLSGRVVVWNEFFLLTTGLTKREAKNLSIFSIVDASQLTELYKFVARALAHNKLPVPSSAAAAVASAAATPSQAEMIAGPTKVSTSINKSSDESWQAITLQCIRFASKKNKDEATHPNPLYITIALMTDADRDKRCFHCIITDSPGTKGTLGSVTPELLSVLFAPHRKGNPKEGSD